MRQAIAKSIVGPLATGVILPVVLAMMSVDPWTIIGVTALAIVAVLLWGFAPPTSHTPWRQKMWPIGAMFAGLVIFAAGAYWLHRTQIAHSDGVAIEPRISFQKYALFWVELDPDVYQLKAVLVLVNADNVPHFITAVNFNNISLGSKARGSMYLQRGLVQTGKSVEIDGDNYIEAGKQGYFPVELPVKLFAHHNAGAFPLVYTFGTWTIQVGEQRVNVSPRRTNTYEHSLSEQQWSALLKSNSEIKIDDLDFERMPAPPGQGPEVNYMVFNNDKSARIDDPWFAQTPAVKTDDGAIMFIRGKGEPPLEGGWVVLGHTYKEVWSDPRKLELYNSMFPPDEDGKPRPFGVFAGAEKEMMGD